MCPVVDFCVCYNRSSLAVRPEKTWNMLDGLIGQFSIAILPHCTSVDIKQYENSKY
jgi:hypothetical protein